MTQPKFTLEVHEPFSTFTEGQPTPIPYVIDGLLPKAAFSVLGGKAKHGKSSMSRIEAVAVTKGQPFLDRQTEQGEVLLCSLEDPRQHVDNCLAVLGHDKANDARIHIVTKLPRDVSETVGNLSDYIGKNKGISLVILDTLAKVLRAKDSGNYDEMLSLCEQLHLLARDTGVHIQALAHCKKVQTEDPFDAFLGSVEIRAESDTNIALFASLKERNGEELLSTCLDSIPGRRQTKYEVRDELIKDKVIEMTGIGTKSNPLRLKLLKPDWSHCPVTISAPMTDLAETPVVESPYITCADEDCTSQVGAKGEYCYRHKQVAAHGTEVLCIN